MEWLPVNGWNGRYEVSDSGCLRKASGAAVGQWVSDQGYCMARLSSPRRLVRVHRLVAEAFVNNDAGLPFVNHIDNNRANNDHSNLEWCTQAGNLAHMSSQGRRATPWAGKRSPNAKLTTAQAKVIRNEYQFTNTSQQYLANKHGVSKRTVGRIVNGESYA